MLASFQNDRLAERKMTMSELFAYNTDVYPDF